MSKGNSHKIRLKDLAATMGLNKESKVSSIRWEKECVRLCAKCGKKLVKSSKNSSIMVCIGEECGYTRQIRYGERQAGEFIHENKEFHTRIAMNRDFFEPLHSFGLVPEIVDKLKRLDCKTIMLRDRINYCSYNVSFDMFNAHSFGYKLRSDIIMQYLNIKYWNKEDSKSKHKKKYEEKR